MNKNIPKAGRIGLADVLDLNKKQAALSINAVKIGIIRNFDPQTQRADVEIAYKQVKDVLEDGTKVYQEYPVLMDLPVIVLFGGVDILTLPIQAGDSCLVFFNDNEIDQWAVNGNGQNFTTFRMHDLSDGIALVGIRPLTNSITNYLANGIRLSHGGGNSQIDLTDSLIETIATLFLHNGSMQITQNLEVGGTGDFGDDVHVDGIVYCDAVHINSGGGYVGDLNVTGNITATGSISGNTLSAANGATGTFSNTVTVVNGIVVSGT